MSELLAKYEDVGLGDINLVSDFIVSILGSGSVVLFYGDLGSGKTTLCSNIIKAFLAKRLAKQMLTKQELGNQVALNMFEQSVKQPAMQIAEQSATQMEIIKSPAQAIDRARLKLGAYVEAENKNQFKKEDEARNDYFNKNKIHYDLKDKITVTSPTFNILHTYQIDDIMLVNHYDLYRIESMQELTELGFLESLSNNITLIEWPKFLRNFFMENQEIANILEVHINYKENSRDFLIQKLDKKN